MNKSIFKTGALYGSDSYDAEHLAATWVRYMKEVHVHKNLQLTKAVIRNEEAIRQSKELAVSPQVYGFSTLLLKELEGML
jgi:hypothetical protein